MKRYSYFSNPYSQLINPDDPVELLARIRLENSIPRKLVERTTPNSPFGNLRKTAYDVGTYVNEGRAQAGALLNKHIANPMREKALLEGLTEAEKTKYYRDRYIGLPGGAIGASLGTGLIPGVGGIVDKYIETNLDYTMNHGFDKYLSEKGVNLAKLKLAEGIGEIGDKLKLDSIQAAEGPDAVLDLGHKVIRGTAATAAGLGGLGYLAGRRPSEQQATQSQYSYMSPSIALFNTEEAVSTKSEEGVKKAKEYVKRNKAKIKAKASAIGGVSGAVMAPVALKNKFEHAPKTTLAASSLLGGGVGRLTTNILSNPAIDAYYETKGKLLGPEAIPDLEDLSTSLSHLYMPLNKSVGIGGGLLAGSALTGYGLGRLNRPEPDYME